MRAMILGYEPVEYVKKGTDQHKVGLSLYYAAANDRTLGLRTADQWVDKQRDAALYDLIMSADVSEPVWADMMFDVQVGSRYPRLVDIVLDA